MATHTPLGTAADFFRNLRAGSKVKQKIVADYFVYYNRVMARRNEKVGYADLFAGPGVYTDADGLTHKSTPVLVTEAAIADPLFRSKVHLWFNEGDRQNHKTLNATVRSVADVKTLRYEPGVTDKVVDSRWPKTMAHLPVLLWCSSILAAIRACL